LPIVWRLDEEIDTEALGESWLIVYPEFTMVRVPLIERPCVQSGMDQGDRSREVHHGSYTER
jgi:hypothetical protein